MLVLKFRLIRINWSACQITGLDPEVSESVGLEWGLRICLANKFSGDTNAADGETTIREALVWKKVNSLEMECPVG